MITPRPREWALAQLGRMLRAHQHRESYTHGTWADESLGIYIGWTAHKGSFSDCMPVRNENDDVVLFFAGEEFPAPEVLSRLRMSGHKIGASNASYLVHAYEDDNAFPVALNGRFHGLVVDRRQRLAKLFNDRYGMQRLYCSEGSDAFWFAAEAKGILAVQQNLACVDEKSFGEFVVCGCVLENRTLFKGIGVLPPSSLWTFRDKVLEQRRTYFDPREWEEQDPLDPESYYQALRNAFSGSLSRYFAGEQRVGISLTGGLDTRMILAWHASPPNSLPCYTFGSSYHECEDVRIAREVAGACKQTHRVITVGSEFLSTFTEYAERVVTLTDGCVEVGRAPVLYTNERVADIAPVRITGNYGSEILRRLVAFKPTLLAGDLFQRDLEPHFANAKATYQELTRLHPLSFIAFRQMPWHHWGLLSLEQSQLTPRSPFLDNEVVKVAFRAPNAKIVKSSLLADNDDCMRLIREGNPALYQIRTDRGLGPKQTPLQILRRFWLECTFKAEYEYDYGMPQWLAQLDHQVSGLHLERLFLGRHKYYHFRVWYRDALSEYVRQVLLDPRSLSRGYIDRKGVARVVAGHLQGGHNYTSELHKLLTLELIYRLFIDSRPGERPEVPQSQLGAFA